MVFDEMLLEGTLYPHLAEMDNAVHRQIEQTMQTLMQQSTAPNRQTDPMGWTQWMNALQSQAEELAMQQILQPVIQEPQAESDTTPSAFSVPISDLPPLSDELILGLLAKESSSRTDNAAILEYFNEHPDLAERSACKALLQTNLYIFVRG